MSETTPGLWRAALVDDVEAWFTGAELPGVTDANLAHHRPHLPERLAAARNAVATLTGTDAATWHLMRQVHGASVAVIDATTPPGRESRGVDVLVTAEVGRPLVVLVADCLPILMAGRSTIAAVHAGWRGLVADAPGAAVRAMLELGERAEDIRVATGPGIGPCCYEVGPEVIAAISSFGGAAITTTSDGRPAVDLHAAAVARLEAVDVAPGAMRSPCTKCRPGSFSHRRDRAAGRQAGIVVRRAARAAAVAVPR
jgi:YfiH family protein